MNIRLRRPSPALVIACIALFVSLGGVSYGFATGTIDGREIKNSTITTKDLRNNQVRGADIRNSTIGGRDVALDTLGGNDIKESTLRKVPEADSVDGVDSGQFVRKEAPAFSPLPLNSEPRGQGWTNADTQVGYDVDGTGYVHLRGSMNPGLLGAGAAFTLPEAIRPRGEAYFAVPVGNGVATLNIDSIGRVTVSPAPSAGDLVHLDGVSFAAGGN